MTLALFLSAALAIQPSASPAHSGAGAAGATATMTAAAAQQADADRIFVITVSFLFADVELHPGDARLRFYDPDEDADSDAPPTLHFATLDSFRVDDERWYLRLGDNHSISGQREDPMVEFAMALASPRISVREGDDATVVIGEQLPFLVRRDDGAFELRHDEDLTEGVMVDVGAPTKTDRGVAFERLAMRVSEEIGREEVEGLPFKAGRPILKTTEVSFAPEIPRDRVAFVRVPGFVHEEGLLYLAIHVVEADDE